MNNTDLNTFFYKPLCTFFISSLEFVFAYMDWLAISKGMNISKVFNMHCRNISERNRKHLHSHKLWIKQSISRMLLNIENSLLSRVVWSSLAWTILITEKGLYQTKIHLPDTPDHWLSSSETESCYIPLIFHQPSNPYSKNTYFFQIHL